MLNQNCFEDIKKRYDWLRTNNSCNLQFLLHYYYVKTAGKCNNPLCEITCGSFQRQARPVLEELYKYQKERN